ncbi:MAG: prohibitin family protein, partial [Myxococcota bacterium]|nr:prohibitin family protein [Myxococcota bacterium]
MRFRVLVLAVAMLGWGLTGCVVVEDGEVGVQKSFGSISDEPVAQGIVFQVPVVRTVTRWN